MPDLHQLNGKERLLGFFERTIESQNTSLWKKTVMLRHAFHLFAIIGATALISVFSLHDARAVDERDFRYWSGGYSLYKYLVDIDLAEVKVRKKEIEYIQNEMEKYNCHGAIEDFTKSGMNLGKFCSDLIADLSFQSILLKVAEQSLEKARKKYRRNEDKLRRALGQRIAELALQKFYQRAAEEKESLVEKKRAAEWRRNADKRRWTKDRRRRKADRWKRNSKRKKRRAIKRRHSKHRSAIAATARRLKALQGTANRGPRW